MKGWYLGLLQIMALVLALQSGAEVIHLKDGTVLETEKAWHKDGYIHFILKGTQDVEIRYSMEIVDRVEKEDGTPLPITGEADRAPVPTSSPVKTQKRAPRKPAPAAKATPEAAKPIPVATGREPKRYKVPSATQSTPPMDSDPQQQAELALILSAEQLRLIEQHRDILFYDPRRPKRYWAFNGSRHGNLQSALDAMAGHYGQSRAWVEQHMGNTNNLGRIHRNLGKTVAAHETSKIPPDQQKMAKPAALPQAVLPQPKALPPQTAEAEAPSQESETPKANKPAASPSDNGPSLFDRNIPKTDGIEFYNPRREHRYWTAKDVHHDRMQDAIEALAKQYDRSTEWVLEHMGETNDLAKIHRNLKSSQGQ